MRIEAFEHQKPVFGDRVRLEPMTAAHLDGVWAMVNEPATAQLTGTHGAFTFDQVRQWTATRHAAVDRADWAIQRQEDGVFLGEAVLNELDVDNAAANFRIALVGPGTYGQGYGTEATRLAVDYAFNVAQLHRVRLEVYAFNHRARAVYEKCGFIVEGIHRDALLWKDRWHDAISMAILATDRG